MKGSGRVGTVSVGPVGKVPEFPQSLFRFPDFQGGTYHTICTVSPDVPVKTSVILETLQFHVVQRRQGGLSTSALVGADSLC